ncbi:hypothetical protein AA313_de0201800 [Arthrobotrys entomopaga]|nr:hypothetical protein AA313_de0201800 [Arthrobotrys entomopaga]
MPVVSSAFAFDEDFVPVVPRGGRVVAGVSLECWCGRGSKVYELGHDVAGAGGVPVVREGVHTGDALEVRFGGPVAELAVNVEFFLVKDDIVGETGGVETRFTKHDAVHAVELGGGFRHAVRTGIFGEGFEVGWSVAGFAPFLVLGCFVRV